MTRTPDALAELMPCPFCGGPASLDSDPHNQDKTWCGFCRACDFSLDYTTQEDAIAAWNRCATDDRLALAESRLAEAVKALEATKDAIRELRLAGGACEMQTAQDKNGPKLGQVWISGWDRALHAACEIEGIAASTLSSIKPDVGG